MYCLLTNAGTPNNIKCRYPIIITIEEEGGFSALNDYVVSEPAFAAAAEPVSPIVPIAPPEALLSGGGVQGRGGSDSLHPVSHNLEGD